MNNVLKKVLSLSLASILAMSAVTSCSKTQDLLAFIGSEAAGTDFEGYNLKILDMVSETGYTFLEYKENTAIYDALLQHIESIEKEKNCIITFTPSSHKKISDIVAMAAADNLNADAIYGAHLDLKELARGGVSLSANEFQNIVDIKNFEKYGTPSVQEVNSYKGNIIALSPLSWPTIQPSSIDLLIFNMDNISRYGKAAPQEHLENDAWNWKALETVISDYYVQDPENPIYSLTCRSFDLLRLLCFGNGVSMTYKDVDGMVKSGFGTPEMMEAIDFYNKLSTENYEKFAIKPDIDPSWDDLINSFAKSQNSMACLITPALLYSTIAYDVGNYSVMPFPTGPNGEYGLWPSVLEGISGFAVLKSSYDSENAFKVIDIICNPIKGYETKELRLDFLMENIFYNRSDAEIATTAYQNGTYSYWADTIGSSRTDDLWRELALNYTKSAAEILSKNEEMFNSLITEYMTPNLKIHEYFN